MNRRYALLTALAILAVLLTGCAAQDGGSTVAGQTADPGVDIVVPYATTTISPENTPSSEAVFIDADGLVRLNDQSVLENRVGEQASDTQKKEYGQLRLGSTGTAVSAMQERLAELGYFAGGISGVFDEETENAVKLFEQGYGIMQTGIATAAMQERLFSSNALVYKSDAYMEAVYSHYTKLNKGDTGSGVIAMQNRLKELGYPVEEITGIYDEATAKAVNLFYNQYGYEGRDYAIVDLQKVLFSDGAKAYTVEAAVEAGDASGANLVMREGDSGTRVSQLQIRLKELGYLTDANGRYDAVTADAVSRFQTACRMTADGVASLETQKQLFTDDAPRSGEIKQIYSKLQWGDSGEGVTNLQNRLLELGYVLDGADGLYSDSTVAAVRTFQQMAEMEQTGVASVELQELLFTEDAPLSPERQAEIAEDEAAVHAELSTLIFGDTGANVEQLQQYLTDLEFYEGTIDGQYGAGTRLAVRSFQEALGVEMTGDASGLLMNILMSPYAPHSGTKLWKQTPNYQPLKPGDSGDEVLNLQKRLYKLGYLNKDDVADTVGTYEQFTADAVNRVMKEMGCARRDGTCSSEFLAFLYSKAADALKIE